MSAPSPPSNGSSRSDSGIVTGVTKQLVVAHQGVVAAAAVDGVVAAHADEDVGLVVSGDGVVIVRAAHVFDVGVGVALGPAAMAYRSTGRQ